MDAGTIVKLPDDRIEETATCEGACVRRNGGHRGVVRSVIVSGGRYLTTGLPRRFRFRYCEQAIEEDRSNGFDVEVADD